MSKEFYVVKHKVTNQYYRGRVSSVSRRWTEDLTKAKVMSKRSAASTASNLHNAKYIHVGTMILTDPEIDNAVQESTKKN